MHIAHDNFFCYFSGPIYSPDILDHIILLNSNVQSHYSYPRSRCLHLRSLLIRSSQANHREGWVRSPRNGNHQTKDRKQTRRTQDCKNHFIFRTPTISKLKLIFWPWLKTSSQYMTHAKSTTKFNQFWEMLLKLPVLPSFWPATASRM